MKKLFTLFFFCILSFSISAQSNLIKIGGSYRNTNFLSHTGNQQIGLQLGYSFQLSESLTIEANIGSVSNHWDIKRSDFAFTKKEQNSYLEAIVFFPVLRRLFPSGNLKMGVGYIGSLNTFDYPEMVVIRDDAIESMTTNSLRYDLHEIGLMFDYSYPISSHFVIYGSCGLSASINRSPAYDLAIVENYSSFGSGRHTESREEQHVAHYRVSLGVGYTF